MLLSRDMEDKLINMLQNDKLITKDEYSYINTLFNGNRFIMNLVDSKLSDKFNGKVSNITVFYSKRDRTVIEVAMTCGYKELVEINTYGLKIIDGKHYVEPFRKHIILIPVNAKAVYKFYMSNDYNNITGVYTSPLLEMSDSFILYRFIKLLEEDGYVIRPLYIGDDFITSFKNIVMENCIYDKNTIKEEVEND